MLYETNIYIYMLAPPNLLFYDFHVGFHVGACVSEAGTCR